MKIFIPTKSRVNNQRTLKYMPKELREQCVLVVDENEADAYRKVHKNLLVVPQHLKGISAVRKYIWDTSDDPRICMLDDDLKFHIRSGEGHKLRNCEPEEYFKIFELLNKYMDMGYGHCGISDRNGNNRKIGSSVEELFEENTRYIRVLAYDLNICRNKAVHGRVDVMEDFDIALQLLRNGVPNIVSYYYAQGQVQSNADGGCSTYRTQEVQARAAEKMKLMHPKFVRVVEKETKTAWGWGSRKDVVISWKKAYASSQN